MKSEVYFAPVEARDLEARSVALSKLLDRIADKLAYRTGEIVPVKLTIGDADCIHHMSPELVAGVIARVKASGARPFLFDTGVIYHGQRQNAVDHLALAHRKGFEFSRLGAPFIVADGLLGQDGKEYDVDAQHIKKVRVPSFVGMLDSLLVLTHATGHVFSGFAGSIKNVAMGMSARATKQVQHSSLKPSIIQDKCTACGCCIRACPVSAIAFNERQKAQIDPKACIGCGECLCACKFEAVFINWDEDMEVFCARMDETAQFILSKFKRKFFITFAFDITQECDCISTKNDRLVSKNVGILASEDILALDRATTDLMSDDHFFFEDHNAYRKMFDHAARVGLGNPDYQLVKV